jgi:hypothetical protein
VKLRVAAMEGRGAGYRNVTLIASSR